VGFLRAPDGTITVFDVPGAGTAPGRGTIAFCDNDFDAILHRRSHILERSSRYSAAFRSGVKVRLELPAIHRRILWFLPTHRGTPRLPGSAGGVRFTYLGDKVGLQANNMGIDAASTQLVDQFAVLPHRSDRRAECVTVAHNHDALLSNQGVPAVFIRIRWHCLFSGLFVTVPPLLVVGVFARAVLKMNFMALSGLLAGSMTDPPALAFASNISRSDAPTVSYATVYPLTMVLRILSAQLLVLLLCG
jgi:hypothetical protein